MIKKAFVLTRPPLHAKTRISPNKAAARSATRRIMSVTSADGRESVSAHCLRREAYFTPYVEPLSDARTKLADFFNILSVGMKDGKSGA